MYEFINKRDKSKLIVLSIFSEYAKTLKLTYRPSDYRTYHIIRRSITEGIPERRDEVDGFRLDVAKVEVYVKQLILWIRILITVVLLFSVVTSLLWNFVAPTIKEVSDRVIVQLLNSLSCSAPLQDAG